jgi:hypothetical protein
MAAEEVAAEIEDGPCAEVRPAAVSRLHAVLNQMFGRRLDPRYLKTNPTGSDYDEAVQQACRHDLASAETLLSG